jgi:5'-nucleotidase
MKYVIITALLFSVFLNSSGQEGRKIVILHTNDLHSRLNGYAPESLYTPLKCNDDKTSGGFARIASIIRNEKENNPGITIVCDAGDFLMGTLFHSLEVTTGFQLRLMKKMGYDIVSLGNHEFDFGPEKLAEIVDQSAGNGEIPPLILSNIVFDKADRNDNSLEKLYTDNIICRKFILRKDGLKIGFFSLLGKDASEVAPLSKPVKFIKAVAYAKKAVKELRDEKCNIIICLSHSGVTKQEDGSWEGEDVKLARKIKGLDLIISGHTHTSLDKPLIVNGVPIIQSGEYGKNVGRLEMTWSSSGLKVDNYRLIPVNDEVAGDSTVEDIIESQQNQITEKILSHLGIGYSTYIAENDFLLECDEYGDFKSSNLGPMIADAIRYYVNRNTAGGTDISMVAVGVIRDKIVPGKQIPADIFRVMSLGSGNDNVPGYPLARLYLTGKELKSVLEILQVAYKSSSARYCFYSGLKVLYDPKKGLLRKIKKIEILGQDNKLSTVDFSRKNKKLYSLTANSYMLEFIGIIKKMSFGLIKVVPKDIRGNPITDMSKALIDIDEKSEGIQEGKEWLALLEYIKQMNDENGNGIPEIDKKYKFNIPAFVVLKH